MYCTLLPYLKGKHHLHFIFSGVTNDIQPYHFEPEGTLEEEDDSKWLIY